MGEPLGRGESADRLSGDEAARLAGQIADLTEARLPLHSGLRALAKELAPGRLRRVLDRISTALESGMPLDAAIAAQGTRVPAHLRGLVTAGARTGRFSNVLGRFAGYTNVGSDVRRALALRLFYPAFSVTFAACVFVFVCVVLMAGFTRIFQDFGIAMPLITRWVLAVASAVAKVWWPLLQGVLVLVGIWLALTVVLRREVRRALIATLPLIGTVWHLTSLAEFCHLLGLLLESEVPLVEALPMAGAGVEAGEIASASQLAANDVAAGHPLSEAMQRPALFSAGFARILDWAQHHHGLPEALHMAGEMFLARARSQASFLATLCGVLSMLSIIGGVATVIVAVMIPLIGLISRLAG